MSVRLRKYLNEWFHELAQGTIFGRAGAYLRGLYIALRVQLLDFLSQVDEVDEASTPEHATGDDLDRWGELLETARATGESDAVYRVRVLAAFRAMLAGPSVQAMLDIFESVMSYTAADYIEGGDHAALWRNDGLSWTLADGIWWAGQLQMFTLYIVAKINPSAPEIAALEAKKLEFRDEFYPRKLAHTRIIVCYEDSGGGLRWISDCYNREREA